jgi:hypothetical protein
VSLHTPDGLGNVTTQRILFGVEVLSGLLMMSDNDTVTVFFVGVSNILEDL